MMMGLPYGAPTAGAPYPAYDPASAQAAAGNVYLGTRGYPPSYTLRSSALPDAGAAHPTVSGGFALGHAGRDGSKSAGAASGAVSLTSVGAASLLFTHAGDDGGYLPDHGSMNTLGGFSDALEDSRMTGGETSRRRGSDMGAIGVGFGLLSLGGLMDDGPDSGIDMNSVVNGVVGGADAAPSVGADHSSRRGGAGTNAGDDDDDDAGSVQGSISDSLSTPTSPRSSLPSPVSPMSPASLIPASLTLDLQSAAAALSSGLSGMLVRAAPPTDTGLLSGSVSARISPIGSPVIAPGVSAPQALSLALGVGAVLDDDNHDGVLDSALDEEGEHLVSRGSDEGLLLGGFGLGPTPSSSPMRASSVTDAGGDGSGEARLGLRIGAASAGPMSDGPLDGEPLSPLGQLRFGSLQFASPLSSDLPRESSAPAGDTEIPAARAAVVSAPNEPMADAVPLGLFGVGASHPQADDEVDGSHWR